MKLSFYSYSIQAD